MSPQSFHHLSDEMLVLVMAPHFPEVEGVTRDPEQAARYLRSRLAGHPHGFASIVATRRFPGTIGTDRAFLEGRKYDGSQFEGGEATRWVGETYRQQAEAAGVNTAGKYYLGTLADRPGDPKAWVSGPDDVRRVCRERGWGCDGAVREPTPDVEPPDPDRPYRAAPDIVERHLAKELAGEGVDAPRSPDRIAERREAVANRLSGSTE